MCKVSKQYQEKLINCIHFLCVNIKNISSREILSTLKLKQASWPWLTYDMFCSYRFFFLMLTESWENLKMPLFSWRRLLRVPWTARRSNQSILKEINPRYSLEGLVLKLKLQYFHYLMPFHWKRAWCWERLRLTEEGDGRGWDGWMASPTQLTWVWAKSRR